MRTTVWMTRNALINAILDVAEEMGHAATIRQIRDHTITLNALFARLNRCGPEQDAA
jgi:hypothetical protein